MDRHIEQVQALQQALLQRDPHVDLVPIFGIGTAALVDDLARDLGLIGESDQAPDEFTFTFSDIKGEDADRVRYRVGSMRDVLTWDVPETVQLEDASGTESLNAIQGKLIFA